MSTRVQRCFWEKGHLVIETTDSRHEISSVEAIKALKQNRFYPDEGDSEGVRLFDPDSPRRMILIQEHLSGPRD
jgi:hypothetical protein